MKLSELVSEARNKSGIDDPEIRIAGHGGFLDISELLTSGEYYDYGKSDVPESEFICIEVEVKD